MAMNITPEFSSNNRDDVKTAVEKLNEFTHYWCLNCEETDKTNDLVFKCKECLFAQDDGKCLIKMFKCEHYPEFKDFGCMGDL